MNQKRGPRYGRSASIAEELKCLREEHEAGRSSVENFSGGRDAEPPWMRAWRKAEAMEYVSVQVRINEARK